MKLFLAIIFIIFFFIILITDLGNTINSYLERKKQNEMLESIFYQLLEMERHLKPIYCFQYKNKDVESFAQCLSSIEYSLLGIYEMLHDKQKNNELKNLGENLGDKLDEIECHLQHIFHYMYDDHTKEE